MAHDLAPQVGFWDFWLGRGFDDLWRSRFLRLEGGQPVGHLLRRPGNLGHFRLGRGFGDLWRGRFLGLKGGQPLGSFLRRFNGGGDNVLFRERFDWQVALFLDVLQPLGNVP